MSTISCPECQASIESSGKKCPECGATIVVFNGLEWSTMTGGEKIKTYSVFVGMSLAVSWVITALLSWIIGDLSISSLSHDVVYYGAITMIALLIFRSTTKAFKSGEMNS